MLKIIIFVIILCCTPVGLFFGPSTMCVDAKQPLKNPINVKLSSSRVGPENEENINPGNPSVRYLGTLLLDSPHPAFGGFSDLLVSEDRKSFLAVSDMGFWLKAGISYTATGELAGVSETARLGQLLNTEGMTYAIKFNADAEGLSRAPGSGYLVSFERIHRINRFDNKDKLSLAGTPTDFPVPDEVAKLPENSGIESMLLLPDNRLMILSEGDDSRSPGSYGAVENKGSWFSFNYVRSDSYRPTSAGNFPGNEVVVLERRYKGPGTLGIRLRKFPAEQLKAGVDIEPETYLEIKPPLPRDNFEGLDTITEKDGKTYIYIISDDNFSPVQHTLLTLFEVSPETRK